MHCVVCARSIAPGAEQYPDAWERSRRRYPCCSDDCCLTFDADTHWLPAIPPQPADSAEQARLLMVTAERVRRGDSPPVVVREMLLAGVGPTALGKLLRDAHINATRHQEDERRTGALAMVALLLSGRGRFRRADQRAPDAIQLALVDLDVWNRRWPSPP